jgi:hypothetical protein
MAEPKLVGAYKQREYPHQRANAIELSAMKFGDFPAKGWAVWVIIGGLAVIGLVGLVITASG